MSANRCPNQNCDYFNRVLPNNARVCPMCGTPVGNVISSPPAQPNTPPPYTQASPPVVEQPRYPNSTHFTVEQQRVPYVQPQPSYTPAPQRFPLLKLIHSSGREYSLAGEAGYIGRRSQSMTLPPEIDLTGIPNEGIISRRHARIYWDWSQNAYMIVDMSTNGVYLNGNLLTPGVQYRLFNGDSLKLGQENLINFQVVVM
ncbi:FHA domain-containing protein [Brasilonema sp. UFV-L1]|uniref:FHA domain-containing protein n=1 Tax=Brasilonema sp. UFV-L1 TaxID=2234130 RepID=UPI00145CAD8D|nr:FHA domain-containing protein [Brasilonema sp. UFV-L1]NMG10530.1 FHA domain-containing protein [Brasilonema sp. UFV-L1]